MIANQSKYFISTGFPELDKIITGIDRRNENMVIAARSGVGKSWVMLLIAAAASKQGLTVGIYSGEMSVDKVAYRIDTLLGKIDNKQTCRRWCYDSVNIICFSCFFQTIYPQTWVAIFCLRTI
jgi:replicative DNA helicase